MYYPVVWHSGWQRQGAIRRPVSSAGIRGAQVILNPEDLKVYTEAEYASLTIE